MKIQKNHLHANSLYKDISMLHFVYLWVSLMTGKLANSKSVTTHLPLEIQHPRCFSNFWLAAKLVRFGEWWKKVLRVNLYWENAPLLNFGTWDLKYGQTDWDNISHDIDLCLDIGHLILGSKTIISARKRIRKLLTERGDQIKHLHIHENDLIHDQHLKPKMILTEDFLRQLKSGRTFIYEK